MLVSLSRSGFSLGATAMLVTLAHSSAVPEPYAQSKVESGLYFTVIPHLSSPVVKTSELLLYTLQSTNNVSRTVWLPVDQKFAFRVELLSTNGSPISRTKRGREIGSTFENLPSDASRVKLRRTATIGSVEIGRVTDLFQIRDKGRYTLRFQLQLFVADGNKGLRLVRFAPVDLTVFHE